MSKRRKPRALKPGSEAAQFDELLQIQRALREYERDGHVSDPVLAARVRAGWRPSVEMALWAIQPDCPDGIRAICLKTLVEREPSKVELMRLADGGDRTAQIVIQIAGWAAPERAPKVIELQPAVDLEAAARRINSPVSAHAPEPSHERRDRLAAAASASATTHIVEVDPSPASPRRVIGEVSMRGGLKRKPAFEPRAHEAAPDISVKSDFDPFK